MLESLFSLISITLAIFSANVTGYIREKEKVSTAKSIAGVFLSVLTIKLFGRLGFGPNDIVLRDGLNFNALIINITISLVAGSISSLLAQKLKKYMKQGNDI